MTKNLWRNRNSILLLALVLGLVLHQGAYWTNKVTLPALAIVMTLSTMSVSGNLGRSFRSILPPALIGIGMNYVLLGGFLLAMNAVLIREKAIWYGFVLLAAAPPAVAVIPFTDFLNGDRSLSLLGTMGAYLGALILMPLIALGLLGSSLIDPVNLLMIMLQLIIIPLILSRVLMRTRFADYLEPIKGAITNWSFFVVVYTIVGLNREVFLGRPLSMVPVFIIAFASTFLLGFLIEWITKHFQVHPEISTSLVLLGTLKNYGLTGGLALAIFSRQTAVPATVSTIFMIVYVIWLGMKKERVNSDPPRRHRPRCFRVRLSY